MNNFPKSITQWLSLFCVLAILGFIQACTGYNDGPNISFSNPEKKMANKWKISEAVLNTHDVTERYAEDFFAFEEDGDFSYLDQARILSFPPFTQSDTLPVLGLGTWAFLEKKNHIEFLYLFNYQDPLNPDTRYEEEIYQQWTITRLTEEEFWIKNDSMSFKLEPI